MLYTLVKGIIRNYAEVDDEVIMVAPEGK